jgi:hypothetical protein
VADTLPAEPPPAERLSRIISRAGASKLLERPPPVGDGAATSARALARGGPALRLIRWLPGGQVRASHESRRQRPGPDGVARQEEDGLLYIRREQRQAHDLAGADAGDVGQVCQIGVVPPSSLVTPFAADPKGVLNHRTAGAKG